MNTKYFYTRNCTLSAVGILCFYFVSSVSAFPSTPVLHICWNTVKPVPIRRVGPDQGTKSGNRGCLFVSASNCSPSVRVFQDNFVRRVEWHRLCLT